MVELINTVVYAGRLKNRETLLKSSSGGVFTALSDLFLDNGEAVVAASYNYDNKREEFCIILNKEERDNARGSKYMQSTPLNVFRDAYQWLKQNPEKRLLFVGMGCQADGFRRFTEEKGVRDRVVIVDIICHGSPSPHLWKEYASKKENELQGKIEYLTFKDKRKGWDNPTALIKIKGREIPIKDYVRIFYNQCALRPSCHECKYATIERKSDLTIGDYWNIEKSLPDFYDSAGNSLILIHTNRGRELFDSAKVALDYRISDTVQCLQHNLKEPTPKSEQREEFWNDYQKKGIDFVMKKYGTVPMRTKIKNKLLRIMGGGEQSSLNYADYSERRAAK